MKTFRIIGALLLLTSLSVSANPGQPSRTQKEAKQSKQSSEPPLLPLTDAERALDLPSLLKNQPDFTADQQFFASEQMGGFGGAAKVARKGQSYWEDNGYFVFILQPGKPVIRMGHGAKVYDPLFAKQDESIVPWREISPLSLSQLSDAKLTLLGAVLIDGHRCLKVEATKPSLEYKVVLYLAEDLNYLATTIQVNGKNRGSIQSLQNISLNVPDSLFDLSSYQAMPLRKWEKVKTARLFCNGKEQPGAIVFRATTGELFVTAVEPHEISGAPMTWHYIVRPDQLTAEVAFQGELKTTDGVDIWQTNEQVAFSGPDTALEHRLYTCRESNCLKVQVGENFVVFPGSEKTKIKVTW